MVSNNLTKERIEQLRQKRQSGATYQTLAREAGLSLEAIWGVLYPSTEATPPEPESSPLFDTPTLPASAPLTERYRPTKLDQLRGQDKVVKVLRKLARRPHPCVLLFEGETGTGKTSAALALAAELGCDLGEKEFGGVINIASGEQTADAVRETCRQMWNMPMYGSGWKVVIVNEVDRMTQQAETIWLDRLEALPGKTVVVFTTNHPDKLTSRFRDRCIRLTFQSGADDLWVTCKELLSDIWRQETGQEPDKKAIARAVERAKEDGAISFRRAVQNLATDLMELE